MTKDERRASLEIELERLGTGIDQCRDAVARYIKNRVSGNSVEDLVQETFAMAQAYVGSGNTLKKPLAFLYKTASFVVSKSYRDRQFAEKTVSVAEFDTLEQAPQAPSAEQNVMSMQEFEAFCMDIARLPEKCREAFVLIKVYRYSYAETAEHCGVSVNTLKNHIKKAFKLMGRYQKERTDRNTP